MIKGDKRRVKETTAEYDEFAEEQFSHNFRCPHCNESLSLSLSKLRLEMKTTNKKEVKK